MSAAINRGILLKTRTSPAETVDTGEAYFWLEGTELKIKDDTQTVQTLAVDVTPESVRDLVAAMISSANNKLNITYTDIADTLVFTVVESNIVHQNLSGAGTNTHSQIDSHIASTSNPHSVTKSQIGLANVQNVDTTIASNITQDSTHRFVTDTEKTTWNAKQDAITGAATSITTSNLTASKILVSDGSGKVAASSTNSSNVAFLDATSSIQTQLDSKVDENAPISSGTNLKITYDAKGLVTAGTTASLDDLSDVAITNPQLNEIIGYNGVNWVNQTNAPQVNAGAGVTFFLTNTASGIGSYDIISKTPDSASEQDEFVSVTNTTTLIEGYISDSEINSTTIDAGIWEFNFYGYVSSTSGATTYTIELYKRTSGGTETLLFSVVSDEINSTSIALYDISTVQPSFACNATDKLLVKIYATTDSLSAVTVHLVHSGSEHYSHFHTPLVTRHNDLASLQGGQTAEYFHLTQSEYTGTGTGNFVRLNSPTLTGTPAVPTAATATNTTQIASTAFVKAQGSSTAPASQALTATASAGSATDFARQDHVHAFDNSGVTAATYGSATQTSQVTFNAKGQATSASNVTIAIPSTQITDFNEAAQDAVGGILTDSTTIDFTYNDAGNTITAAVLPAGVNHNALLNGGGNIHIDHASVLMIAGTGMSGGGDITATRTFNINNTGVTAATYGGTSTVPVITVNAQGQITSASSTNTVNAILTGISIVAGDVAATDSIMQAIGKLAGNDAQWVELINTTQLTSTSNVTLTNVTELQFPVTSGSNYYFEATIVFQTAAGGTGITLSMGSPDGATGSIAAQVNIPIAADGTAALYTGSLTSIADVVTSTGVQTANTDFVATIKGTFNCTTSGNLCPQFRSEVNGNTARFQPRSVLLARIF